MRITFTLAAALVFAASASAQSVPAASLSGDAPVLEQAAPSAPMVVAEAEVAPAVDLSAWVAAPAPLAAPAVDIEEAPQSARMGAQDVAYWGMTAVTAAVLVYAFDWVLF